MKIIKTVKVGVEYTLDGDTHEEAMVINAIADDFFSIMDTARGVISVRHGWDSIRMTSFSVKLLEH